MRSANAAARAVAPDGTVFCGDPIFAASTARSPQRQYSNVCATGQISFRDAPNMWLCREARERFRRSVPPIQPDRLGFTPALREKGLGVNMLWTICVVLLVLWALGIATSYTLGGFIHVLLLLAVVTLLIRVIQGRRVAS